MINQSIGSGGTYATFAAWYSALPGTLADDYTVTVQAGTYNETLDYNRSSNGHSITFVADTGATPVINGTTIGFNLRGTGGEFIVDGLKFIDHTTAGIQITYTASEDTHIIGCEYDGNYRDILAEPGPPNGDMYVNGCLFEDWDYRSCTLTNSPTTSHEKHIAGCTWHTTSGGATDSEYAVANNPAQATSRWTIRGCRFVNDDEDVGFDTALHLFGGIMEHCVVRRPKERAMQLRGSVDCEIRDCYLEKHSTAGDAIVKAPGGTTSTGNIMERCTLISASDNYVRGFWAEVNGATPDVFEIIIRNCILICESSTGTRGLQANSGVAIDNYNNCYYGWGVDQYNNGGAIIDETEAGTVTGSDPDFDPKSEEESIPLAGSPVINAGSTADGLPYTETAPDMGWQQVMPVNLREG